MVKTAQDADWVTAASPTVGSSGTRDQHHEGCSALSGRPVFEGPHSTDRVDEPAKHVASTLSQKHEASKKAMVLLDKMSGCSATRLIGL